METEQGVLPFGFKFKPTNPELIWYLLHKVHGSPLPCDNFIMEFDLYDQRDSWKHIFEGRPGATAPLFFFTKLTKMTDQKGTVNKKRRTGKGKWHETQNCGAINDPTTKKAVGNKRSFKFAPNPDAAAEFTGRWLMDEFSLDSRFAHQNVDDYVVCCIKHERDRKSRHDRVQQTRNLEQSSQENCRNMSNADSIIDTTTAATAADLQDGLADIGDPNFCMDLDELNALLEDSDQLLAPMIQENGRDSNSLFAATPTLSGKSGFSSLRPLTNTNTSNADSIDDTTEKPTLNPESGETGNVQMMNSEQAFEVNCGISEANNCTTEAAPLDFESDAEDFEDPNMWDELDELLGQLDQAPAEPTILNGAVVGSSNSLTASF